MTLALIAFTRSGCVLGEKLAALLTSIGHVAVFSPCTGTHKVDLQQWTFQNFHTADGLIFIGATGIAVRAVAGHLVAKTSDPAIVVLDDNARFVIPLLSGHLGGANELALSLADLLDAQAVITTATDGNGVFAVDSWAKKQGLHIANPKQIKTISAKLLAGDRVRLYSDFPISGRLPEGITVVTEGQYDLCITLRTDTDPSALHLIPPIATVGIGCRRGTGLAQIEVAYEQLLAQGHIHAAAICSAASISLKANEPGLLAFCEAHCLPLHIFSAQQLNGATGEFTASKFVQETTGTDNVCERSAVLASGGRLHLHKNAENGITMALAVADYIVKFEETT
ncbi:MAG: cobalamin biosynthesis protein [Angelakisella sp.]